MITDSAAWNWSQWCLKQPQCLLWATDTMQVCPEEEFRNVVHAPRSNGQVFISVYLSEALSPRPSLAQYGTSDCMLGHKNTGFFLWRTHANLLSTVFLLVWLLWLHTLQWTLLSCCCQFLVDLNYFPTWASFYLYIQTASYMFQHLFNPISGENNHFGWIHKILPLTVNCYWTYKGLSKSWCQKLQEFQSKHWLLKKQQQQQKKPVGIGPCGKDNPKNSLKKDFFNGNTTTESGTFGGYCYNCGVMWTKQWFIFTYRLFKMKRNCSLSSRRSTAH